VLSSSVQIEQLKSSCEDARANKENIRCLDGGECDVDGEYGLNDIKRLGTPSLVRTLSTSSNASHTSYGSSSTSTASCAEDLDANVDGDGDGDGNVSVGSSDTAGSEAHWEWNPSLNPLMHLAMLTENV
jgi:hypothetical protein